MVTTLRQRPRLATPRARTPLRLEALDDRVLLSAAPLRLAVLGDSLSASYVGQPYGAAGDRSWVQQLGRLDRGEIVIHDVAFPGATSNSLLNSESGHPAQVPAAVDLIAHHQVNGAVLIIGANDVDADLPLLATDPASFVSTFVSTVVTNVETAAATLTAAGHVKLVLGNVPDVVVTPAFVASVPAEAVPVVETAIVLANQQIDAFAADHNIPLVDMYDLSHLLNQPVNLGGVTVSNLYAPDFFHPNTTGQAILGNTILEAFHEGYDLNVNSLRLSDQQILSETNTPHHRGRTYFDVTPYVVSTEEAHEHGHDYGGFWERFEHHFGHHGW